MIRRAFNGIGVDDFRESAAAGEEGTLALAASSRGARIVVVVGGDGTCAQVANSLLAARSACAMAVVPCGTGNDFAKTLGVAQLSVPEIAALVDRGRTKLIDVGSVQDVYFLNSCGFGFDAAVLESTQRIRFLKGNAVYIYSALRQLLSYRGITVSAGSATHDGGRRMLMVTVSNGRFLGGAFRIAPEASVLDGQLDVGFVGDSNVFGRVRLFAGALRGTHVALPSFESHRARSMSLRFAEPPMMEVDGELRRARSATVTIECIPAALNVIAAPKYPR